MKQILFIFSLVFVFSTFVSAQKTSPAPPQKSKYIGLKYTSGEKYPDGFEDEGGALITDHTKPPVYGVALLKKGSSRMLWLEYEYARTPDDRLPKWEVKDVLLFPVVKNDEVLLSGHACEINGKSETNLTVLANFSPRRKTYTVRRAWRANVKTEKFEELPTRGIKCYYEEP